MGLDSQQKHGINITYNPDMRLFYMTIPNSMIASAFYENGVNLTFTQAELQQLSFTIEHAMIDKDIEKATSEHIQHKQAHPFCQFCQDAKTDTL